MESWLDQQQRKAQKHELRLYKKGLKSMSILVASSVGGDVGILQK